jgi:hypothetical protein
VRHAERALAIDPTSYGALRNLGTAWRVLALHRAGHGLDPGEAVAKGRAAMTEAAPLAQPDSQSHLELALLALAELRWALHTDADPLPAERARSLDPDAVETLAYQGALLALAAEEEPEPERSADLACRAVDALERGLAAKPALRVGLEPVLAEARRLGGCRGRTVATSGEDAPGS